MNWLLCNCNRVISTAYLVKECIFNIPKLNGSINNYSIEPMNLFRNLLKKENCSFQRRCNIYVRTFPQTHFLIKCKEEDAQFHIKESFTGLWEKTISLKDEQHLSIDTFVTNHRGYQKITCHITVEVLGSCNNTLHLFNESYTISNNMEDWKWVKHQFEIPVAMEAAMQIISA